MLAATVRREQSDLKRFQQFLLQPYQRCRLRQFLAADQEGVLDALAERGDLRGMQVDAMT
ncbi:MAG: hypothetical protein WC073_15055 [Sterolibacterium sp.]